MSTSTLRAATKRAASSLIARSPQVRAGIRALDRRLAPGDVRVLCYHGITAAPLAVADPCFTTAKRFAEQMRYLAAHFDVLHLEDAFDPDRSHPRPVACVTFDDGFAGVHDHAFPVLAELGLPATAFVVTDLLDTDGTVWFSSLHQAITETTASTVEHDGDVHPLTDAAARSRASMALQSRLKALDAPEFGPAFTAVMEQLCPSVPAPGEEFAILSSEQVRAMARDDVVRIGGHSATHQILTRTTPALAASEITRSVTAVAQLVERPSAAFAYPNGGFDDFDDACIDELRTLGIRFAVTTMPGPNLRGDDPYRIRRIVVGADEGPGEFPARVHRLGPQLRGLVPRRTAG